MNGSNDYQGTWGTKPPGQPQLTFQEDGTVTGTDGCNRLIGEWELSDDKVRLVNLASTMMYCEGVDTWLRNARTVETRGDQLHVFDCDGQKIGTLTRR